jgi:hypothetical protein
MKICLPLDVFVVLVLYVVGILSPLMLVCRMGSLYDLSEGDKWLTLRGPCSELFVNTERHSENPFCRLRLYFFKRRQRCKSLSTLQFHTITNESGRTSIIRQNT